MTWGESSTKMVEKDKQEIIESHTAKTLSNRGLVFLVYGNTNTGKTYFSHTCPEPIYYIDTENRAINTKEILFSKKNITVYEPVELKKTLTKSMDDIFDEVASINNLTTVLSDYIGKVQSGEIKGGTIVIDSCSDLWSWVQAYMFDKLSKMTTKSGQARADADMQTVLSQLDWKIANDKHNSIVKMLRSLVSKGIYVVFTAKEKQVPEYVTANGTISSSENNIKCQKDLPFVADVILYLKKKDGKYMGYCEKLGIQETVNKVIEKPTFEKIMELHPLG